MKKESQESSLQSVNIILFTLCDAIVFLEMFKGTRSRHFQLPVHILVMDKFTF